MTGWAHCRRQARKLGGSADTRGRLGTVRLIVTVVASPSPGVGKPGQFVKLGQSQQAHLAPECPIVAELPHQQPLMGKGNMLGWKSVVLWC